MEHQYNNEKSLCIFDGDDKNNTNIDSMSDFFSNYVHHFCSELNSKSLTSIIDDIPIADIGIFSSMFQNLKLLSSGKYEYVADFSKLPKEIKSKLEKGIYKIGDSRQVDGNKWAVILDENNDRIKDITLKQTKIDVEPVNIQNILIHIQLKQIYSQLTNIHELQSYQIDLIRNQSIVTPFLNARDSIVYAQNSEDSQKRVQYLREADKELKSAMNYLYSDISTLLNNLVNLTNKSGFKHIDLINNNLNYLLSDLQLITKFMGVRMQVLNYLEDKVVVNQVLDVYNKTITDFFTKEINKRKQPAIRIIHDYYPYTDNNRNYWWNLSKKFDNTMTIDMDKKRELVLVSIEDVIE